MLEYVIGGCEGVTYRFDVEEIRDNFGSKRTDDEVQLIADILAANVEEGCNLDEEDEGCLVICRENFNDAFFDMMADIRDMF